MQCIVGSYTLCSVPATCPLAVKFSFYNPNKNVRNLSVFAHFLVLLYILWPVTYDLRWWNASLSYTTKTTNNFELNFQQNYWADSSPYHPNSFQGQGSISHLKPAFLLMRRDANIFRKIKTQRYNVIHNYNSFHLNGVFIHFDNSAMIFNSWLEQIPYLIIPGHLAQ